MILARWLYRAICSVWLLVAWAVGSTLRRFGRNARELESDHQRDGVGLLFLGLAIVFAAAIWARMDNLAGQGIYTLTSAVVGEGAFAIPVLFALVGWRFFRHPDRNSALPPAEIGWTALLIGGLGLFSIARRACPRSRTTTAAGPRSGPRAASSAWWPRGRWRRG